MNLEFDMTGCTRLKLLKGAQGAWTRSKCERCLVPTRDCQWLLHERPYEGSKYIETRAKYRAEHEYSTYSIQYCPMYRGEE